MKNLLNVSSRCDIKYNYILELHVMLMSNVIIIFIYNIDYLDKFTNLVYKHALMKMSQ